MPFQEKKKTERELHSVVSYTELPILIPMLPRNSILQKLQDKKMSTAISDTCEAANSFFLSSCSHFWINPERALSPGKLTLLPLHTVILQQH